MNCIFLFFTVLVFFGFFAVFLYFLFSSNFFLAFSQLSKIFACFYAFSLIVFGARSLR